MRDHSLIQEDLAALRLKFNCPLKVSHFEVSWNNFVSGDILKEKDILDRLKYFLRNTLDNFFKVLQIENISEGTIHIESLVKSTRNKTYIKFKIFENGSYKEANTFLQDIYTKWNDVQLIKELCSDHIVLIKKAIVYLSSLKKVVNSFILNSINYGIKFKTVVDSKKFVEFYVVDIDSYVDILKNQITELSSWIDNTLSSKINMIMRADSSLRLLAKYAEWDKDYNNGSGDTSPKKYGGSSDFNIQES